MRTIASTLFCSQVLPELQNPGWCLLLSEAQPWGYQEPWTGWGGHLAVTPTS
jgi:hypothetical protein